MAADDDSNDAPAHTVLTGEAGHAVVEVQDIADSDHLALRPPVTVRGWPCRNGGASCLAFFIDIDQHQWQPLYQPER